MSIATVAPHAGAWIEITIRAKGLPPTPRSHPTRVRGLKFNALFAIYQLISRTPRGCVNGNI